jgi:hypothetical protein
MGQALGSHGFFLPPILHKDRPILICNTLLFKARLPSSPHMGHAHAFMHNTLLILTSSLLHVKGLTQRSYGWNNEGYMLILTELNNQCGTNHTTPLPGLLGPNHNYSRPLTCYAVTVTPPYGLITSAAYHIYNWQVDTQNLLSM